MRQVPKAAWLTRPRRLIAAATLLLAAVTCRLAIGASSPCSAHTNGLYGILLGPCVALLGTVIRPERHGSFRGHASGARTVFIVLGLTLFAVSVANLCGSHVGLGAGCS